eukprot:SAG25_NODE_327_length_9727_cov_5.510283_3_plen_498_part_00
MYMAVPNGIMKDGKLECKASLEVDLKMLHDAMKGCGTNEDKVIRVLCTRTARQIQALGHQYFMVYGENLMDVIRDEFRGDTEIAMEMLVEGQAKMDAKVLWEALDGLGTNEEALNEILCTRHQGQVDQLEEMYVDLEENTDKKTLWSHVISDTSFKYERFLKSMLNRAGFLAMLCYTAMHGKRYDATGITGIGTDEEKLIRVLLSVNRYNDGIKGVLHDYNDPFDQGWREDLERFAHLPDIQDIVDAYPKLYELGFGVNEECKTLAESIDGDTSFSFKKMLLHLIKDKNVSGAEMINDALNQRLFKDKDIIMIVMASRSGWGRHQVAMKYKELYGVALVDDLREKLGDGGEFAQVARDMFQSHDEIAAAHLYLAMFGTKGELAGGIDESKKNSLLEQFTATGMMGGWGTDEHSLSRIIFMSSKAELKHIKAAYKEKFDRDLKDDIYAETGGDYRKMLMYKFRRQETGLMHVPREKLVRCDDMPSTFPIDSLAKHDIF